MSLTLADAAGTDKENTMEIAIAGGGSLGRVVGRSPGGWRPGSLTWGELLGLEPRLAEVGTAVKAFGRCSRPTAWRSIRATLGQYVGWDSVNAKHPILGSAAAYDSALGYVLGVTRAGR